MYWSPLASASRLLGLGYRRGKFAPAHVAPAAIVVHTTGSGPVERATSEKFAAWRARLDIREGDALRCAVSLYARVMDACGHYVIGQDGTIVQMVPESHAAWHVGGAGSRPYFTNESSCLRGERFRWWRERWPKLATPRELGGGHLWDPGPPLGLTNTIRAGFPIGSANANSIGVEVVPSVKDSRGPWSAEAWHALAALCVDIANRRGMAIRRDTVISHSDAHPLARTTSAGKPWDTGEQQWSWERFSRVVKDIQRPTVAA